MTLTDSGIYISQEAALLKHDPVSMPYAIAQIARLQEMYASAAGASSENAKRHRSDIDEIGTRLIHEADERGWCGLYDEVIKDLNTRLYVELPQRERTIKVRVTAEVTFEIEVEDQTDEEDAMDVATDWINSHMDDHIRSIVDIDVKDAEVCD